MPGRRRDRNYFGLTTDYNPLVRPWYVGSSSAQKDIVILLDCTRSMIVGDRHVRALEVARTVIDTLTPGDRFNVVCMQSSYWRGTCGGNECSTVWWRSLRTHSLGCGEGLQFATPANKKQVLEKLNTAMFDGAEDWARAT